MPNVRPPLRESETPDDDIAEVQNGTFRNSAILPSGNSVMRLYVKPMDAVVVEVDADGRVRLDGEDWSVPTLQERRAIIYSARGEIEELNELIETLQDGRIAGLQD